MKTYNFIAKKHKVIFSVLTAIILIGLSNTASAQQGYYPVDLQHPSGNQTLGIGQSVDIVWNNGGPYVDIYLFQEGQPFLSIADHVSATDGDQSVYTWTVDGNPVGDKHYKIKVIEEDYSPIATPGGKYDISDQSFMLSENCPFYVYGCPQN